MDIDGDSNGVVDYRLLFKFWKIDSRRGDDSEIEDAIDQDNDEPDIDDDQDQEENEDDMGDIDDLVGGDDDDDVAAAGEIDIDMKKLSINNGNDNNNNNNNVNDKEKQAKDKELNESESKSKNDNGMNDNLENKNGKVSFQSDEKYADVDVSGMNEKEKENEKENANNKIGDQADDNDVDIDIDMGVVVNGRQDKEEKADNNQAVSNNVNLVDLDADTLAKMKKQRSLVSENGYIFPFSYVCMCVFLVYINVYSLFCCFFLCHAIEKQAKKKGIKRRYRARTDEYKTDDPFIDDEGCLDSIDKVQTKIGGYFVARGGIEVIGQNTNEKTRTGRKKYSKRASIAGGGGGNGNNGNDNSINYFTVTEEESKENRKLLPEEMRNQLLVLEQSISDLDTRIRQNPWTTQVLTKAKKYKNGNNRRGENSNDNNGDNDRPIDAYALNLYREALTMLLRMDLEFYKNKFKQPVKRALHKEVAALLRLSKFKVECCLDCVFICFMFYVL